jgi:hypothetical protein
MKCLVSSDQTTLMLVNTHVVTALDNNKVLVEVIVWVGLVVLV